MTNYKIGTIPKEMRLYHLPQRVTQLYWFYDVYQEIPLFRYQGIKRSYRRR